jgi:hypothetical protein
VHEFQDEEHDEIDETLMMFHQLLNVLLLVQADEVQEMIDDDEEGE